MCSRGAPGLRNLRLRLRSREACVHSRPPAGASLRAPRVMTQAGEAHPPEAMDAFIAMKPDCRPISLTMEMPAAQRASKSRGTRGCRLAGTSVQPGSHIPWPAMLGAPPPCSCLCVRTSRHCDTARRPSPPLLRASTRALISERCASSTDVSNPKQRSICKQRGSREAVVSMHAANTGA